MSLCPFAVQKLLPENATQYKIVPRIAILHSAAGKGSLYNFFKNSSNLESHFWVSEKGVIEQYIDTNVKADANLNANRYAVSIETESSVQATEKWTPAQAGAIVRLLDWLCTVHDIPRAKCTSPTGSGIGWHIMFGSPGPWTPVSKSCPGPARVTQTMQEIIPAVAKLGQHAPAAKWISFGPGETDRSIAKRGGLDNEVSEVQMILTHLDKTLFKGHGLNPGKINGKYHLDSQKAISNFKKVIIEIQKADKQTPWPNTDSRVGTKTIQMLRFWNKGGK